MEMAHVRNERMQVRWASGLNAVAGLWLILAPFILGYQSGSVQMWNDIILGVLIGAMALVRVAAPLRWQGISWANAVLGLWLVVAPFLLGYSNIMEPLWNDIIVGIIVIGLAIWSAYETNQARHRM